MAGWREEMSPTLTFMGLNVHFFSGCVKIQYQNIMFINQLCINRSFSWAQIAYHIKVHTLFAGKRAEGRVLVAVLFWHHQQHLQKKCVHQKCRSSVSQYITIYITQVPEYYFTRVILSTTTDSIWDTIPNYTLCSVSYFCYQKTTTQLDKTVKTFTYF